jgi:hypothetical protein
VSATGHHPIIIHHPGTAPRARVTGIAGGDREIRYRQSGVMRSFAKLFISAARRSLITN